MGHHCNIMIQIQYLDETLNPRNTNRGNIMLMQNVKQFYISRKRVKELAFSLHVFLICKEILISFTN